MTRTNIDLPDELVAEVMRRYDLPSKRSAVEYALRRVVGASLTPDDIHEFSGVGWDGDLDELRVDRSG